MPWANIRQIQKDPARICPRYELNADNQAAGELALAGIRFGTDHPLWTKLFDIRTDGWKPGRRHRLLYRIMAGLADPEVAARIKAARAKAAKPKGKPKRPRRRR